MLPDVVTAAEPTASPPAPSDEELIARVLAGDLGCFEQLMRRYNSRVFRAARSIVRNDDEAEDVMQQAYVNAYTHLRSFAGRASFSTWLLRIAVHEAFARNRGRERTESLDSSDQWETTMPDRAARDPESTASEARLLATLEELIDAMPERYRSVLVLRGVEGLSASETAEALDLSEEAVRTRLHRARAMLHVQLAERADSVTPKVFDFHLSRCDRVVLATLQRIHPPQESPAS